MSSTKRVKFRNKCVPLEQVNAGSRWWLDSDIGASISSKDTVEGIADFEYGKKIESFTFPENLKFIYIKCKDITSGTVLISLDGTDTGTIKLLTDEGFAARVTSGTIPRVIISGIAGIEFLTGI